MRRRLVPTLVLAASLAGAAPGPAALEAHAVTLELTPRARGAFAASSTVPRFTLAGVRWHGAGAVRLRTRSLDGRWGPWREGAPEAGDGPDALSAERSPTGWHVGSPWWVGPSDGIEVRTSGRVTRVRATLVWSPKGGAPYRRLAEIATPPIVARASWGADEAIRRGSPVYAREVRIAIVHHTAGANDYTRAEAPAVVRGIQLYHVLGNGWNDIGYNFLVDRFGTIYEGRLGGLDRNVVGAHAQGFNTGSVGIAILGTYGDASPSRAAQDAVARLIAWRLDLAHVDPTGAVSLSSGGSDRYPAGTAVQLNSVSGHRDTGLTECPGGALYARLGAIASAARATGGQKLFEPSVEAGDLGVRFRARLLQAGAWAVVVAGPDGVEVARGTGTGTTVDWTWDPSASPPTSYTWSITAGGARPATGTLRAGGASGPLAITDVVAEPAGITPNGDGQNDSAVVTYRLSKQAAVTVAVSDAFGAPIATVLDRAWTRAGVRSTTISGEGLADGNYTVAISALTPDGEAAQGIAALAVSRTLGLVEVSPLALSPNGDGRNDKLVVAFTLTAPATTRVRVVRDGRWVATPLVAGLSAGEQRVVWSGTRSSGAARDGNYRVVVEVEDAVGAVSLGAPFVLDTTAPRVRFVPGRGVRLEVSEPCALTVRIDGARVRREVTRAGVVRIPWVGMPARVRVVAEDPAGNRSPPVTWTRRGGGQAGQ